MRREVSPLMAVIVVVVLLAVIGAVTYRYLLAPNQASAPRFPAGMQPLTSGGPAPPNSTATFPMSGGRFVGPTGGQQAPSGGLAPPSSGPP